MRANFRFLFSVLALSGSSLLAVPYQFNFSSLSSPASSVMFDGNSRAFSFQPDGPGSRDFVISGSEFGDLDGLFGSISGIFSIGAVTFDGPQELAPVTGTGQFSIYDGSGFSATADLAWLDIFTINLGSTLGGLNTLGTVNLTNFSGYSGSNARLQSFVNSSGNVEISFALGQGMNLTDLVADGVSVSNTYSGSAEVESVAVPDSPLGLSIVVLWVGLAVMAGISRTSREIRF